MPNSLTATGITTANQAELIAAITANLQAIYGSDIDLSSNTTDGQWININIQAQLDVQELIKQVYNSFDPDNAMGTQLDQRCAINGVVRQAGTYSTTNITLVLTQAVNLYGLDQSAQPIYTVADSAGNQWFLETTQLSVGPGTVSYAFRAATPGANVTTINTINIPVTVVLGVSSVNNPSAQTSTGLNEETDASLRARRQISVSISSQGYLQGLKAALENINGITSAFVYENKGNTTDGNGVPGHSIWVIVDGIPTNNPEDTWSETTIYQYGDIVTFEGFNYISWKNNNVGNDVTNPVYWGIYNPVAETIYNKRNAGCGMFGDTSYTITQIDGNSFVVLYDTVEEQNLFIAFTASSIDGVNQPDIAGIITYLVQNYNFTVNGEININQMATLVQQADSNCLVTNAGLSLALTQVATLSGIAASGTFKFSYNGNATADINWNDNAATIQSALRAVSGLSAATVTGSIASQTLTIALNVESALGLLTVTNNSLMTSAPAAITFAFNEGYSNTLSPSTKKDKFQLSSSQIIITPMILSPTTVTVAQAGTQQFTGLGGYGTLTYSLQTNVSGGMMSGSGLYTAGNTPGTDIAKVVDAFGNSATATITVPA